MNGKINVGTDKHPMWITASAAVMLANMGERITYVIARNENVNALLNRFLVKEESGFLSRKGISEGKVSVVLTRKGVNARERMKKKAFGGGK